MHMADAFVVPVVAGTMYACSAVTAGYSIKKMNLEFDTKKIPVMGVMGAFIFAAQMINFTIPGTGSSGHLTGGLLLAAILGPYAAFLCMIGVLVVQCFLFGDGGILALGCNIWNMAFTGCFIGYFFILQPMIKNKITKRKLIIASVLGAIVSLQLGAFFVAIQTYLSGITELSFVAFLAIIQPIHLAIGIVEGFVTATILVFLYETKPELIWQEAETRKKILPIKSVILLFGMLTIFLGVVVSNFASENPDGLEWSIGKVTSQIEGRNSGLLYELAEKTQRISAVFPDYSMKNTDIKAGTSLSGFVGGFVVLCLLLFMGGIIKFYRKIKKNE